MARPAIEQRLASRPGVALPQPLAAVGALLGLMMGMVSLGTGWLPLGVAGLLLMGLALGLLGSLRQRLLTALLLWALTVGLTALSAALGTSGFTLIGPVVLCLLFFAAGQFIGVLLAALFHYANNPA